MGYSQWCKAGGCETMGTNCKKMFQAGYNNFFFSPEDSQAVEQVASRGFAVCILEEFQDCIESSCEQLGFIPELVLLWVGVD